MIYQEIHGKNWSAIDHGPPKAYPGTCSIALPTMDDCCDYWPKIRPLLGWFAIDGPYGARTLVMPVIGELVPGAPRVNFCPSCGSPVRDATWTLSNVDPFQVEANEG